MRCVGIDRVGGAWRRLRTLVASHAGEGSLPIASLNRLRNRLSFIAKFLRHLNLRSQLFERAMHANACGACRNAKSAAHLFMG